MKKIIDVKSLAVGDFRPCSKREYVVSIRCAMTDENVYNEFEDAHYSISSGDKDKVIITGTAGEEWVANIDKVIATYVNLDFSKLDREQIYASGCLKVKSIPASDNYCYFVPVDSSAVVETAWGDILTANREGVSHGEGDWLMCSGNGGMPDLSDIWVVNGVIFPLTYELC